MLLTTPAMIPTLPLNKLLLLVTAIRLRLLQLQGPATICCMAIPTGERQSELPSWMIQA